ncbi:hypothetical protein [uncultured Draconibacterium sp.]|uniref:hypothetical protein n=1 Tax=uncultured Draconibacterium sp. TaxID=1573823 RepID=UPI0025FF9636|nr:hypothetical protein [uncultured Draconibacterium sp.]
MDPKLIPILMAILGVDKLEAKDGKVDLSEEQVNSIKSAYKTRFSKDLNLKGLKFEEGYASVTTDNIQAIEKAFNKAVMASFFTGNDGGSGDGQGSASGDGDGAGDGDGSGDGDGDGSGDGDGAGDGDGSAAGDGDGAGDGSASGDGDGAQAASNDQLLARFNALETQNKALQRQIAALGNKPESVTLNLGNEMSTFNALATGLNASSDIRFWNKAALLIANDGNHSMAHALVAASEIDIAQIQDDLGNYFRERHSEIQTFMTRTPSLDAIFPPYGTGIKDELVVTDLFTGEFLQAYNPEWTEKGSFEFKPEIIKVRDYKVDHRFKATELREFIYSWLAPMTQGTNPFQEPLVSFLLTKMKEKITQEKTKALVQGVYLQSADGVAGPVMQSVNGVLKSLQSIREGLRIKPFNLGEWDVAFDSDNHIYKMIARGTQMIPRDIRDSVDKMYVLTSKDGADAFKAYKDALGKNTNVSEKDTVAIPDFIEVKGVPYWNSKTLVWVVPGLIRQFYRQRGEDNRFNTQKEKRDTIVFMDGAAGIAPIKSGYEYASKDEQTYDNQIIFLSDEFDDFTYILSDANDTTPSVKTHNCLKLGDNTQATAITNIDDATEGQVIYLLGTGSSNVSTIANAGNFVLEDAWTAEKNAKLVLVKVGDKFIEIDRELASNGTAVLEFTADDATPSVANGFNFITSDANTGALEITDLDDAVADKTYTINGGGGANATTITNGGNFVLTGGDWTGAAAAWIKFYYTKSGLFKEIGRSA